MTSFANEEYVDMHFVCRFCDGDSRRTEAECCLHYPLRCKPNRGVFAAIHQRLRETGLLSKAYEMGQDHRSATIEEYVIDRVEEDPNVSSLKLTKEAGISQSKVEFFAQKPLSSIPLHTGTRTTQPRFPKAGLLLAVRARYLDFLRTIQ